jgi:hypothetical protein
MSDKPNPIKIQSGGQVTSRENPDGSISLSSKQPVSLHIESIKSVGIENLVDVEVHAINRLFNSVSHYIKFFGGGEVRFSYNAEGNLLEFAATKVDAYVANGESIILRRQLNDSSTPT